MSSDVQLPSDRTFEVRRQLIAAAIDDIFFLIRSFRQSGQTVDDELLAAVQLSAKTITPRSSEEEATNFWRNYAALIVAVRPSPDETPVTDACRVPVDFYRGDDDSERSDLAGIRHAC